MSLSDIPIGLRFAAFTGAVALGAFGVFGIPELRARNAMTEAVRQDAQGLHALAADTIDPYRARLPRFKGGCEVMLSAYEGSLNWSRMEWASQACIEATRGQSPIPVVAMAQAWSHTGRVVEALRMLKQAGRAQFPKDASLPFATYRILREANQPDDALESLREASVRAPQDAQIRFEGMQYLALLKRWKEALPIAESLKDAKIENPEAMLAIARVFLNAGRRSESDALAAKVRGFMASADPRDADQVAALKKAYSDVLGTSDSSAVPRSPAASR